MTISTISIPNNILPIGFPDLILLNSKMKIKSLSETLFSVNYDKPLKLRGFLSISMHDSIKIVSINKIDIDNATLSSETPNKLILNEVRTHKGDLELNNINAIKILPLNKCTIMTKGLGSINEINAELPYDDIPAKIDLDEVNIKIPNTKLKFEDIDQSYLEENQSVLCSSFISCESLMRNVSILPIESLMKDKRVHGVLSCQNTIRNSRVSRCVIVHRVFEDRNDGLSGGSLTSGAIADIVIACLVVVCAAVCAPVTFYLLKKKKSQVDFSPSQ